jgi:hypothetical protein
VSQTGVVSGKAEKMTNQKYAAVMLNGELVQTNADMELEFAGAEDKFRVAVAAFPPSQPGFAFKGFERWSGDTKVIYTILPASFVWVNDKLVTEFNGVGYSDDEKELIFLTPAVVTQGSWVRQSPVNFRSYGTGKLLGRPRKIVEIKIIEPDFNTEAETEPVTVV